MKNPKTKNWQTGSEQVNPGSGDEWARVKQWRDPITGKVPKAGGPAPVSIADLVDKAASSTKGEKI
jgi:hypothetical protein